MSAPAFPGWDVVIVGAGPAGLSAALVLGRCRRRVLVCDRNTPRSWASKAMHSFLSRDGVDPAEFRRLAHRELKRYPGVHFWSGEVSKVTRGRGGFTVRLGARAVRARKLLLATGVMDRVPKVEGMLELFGQSVFQCPYCDGWEFRGQPLAAYGKARRGLEMARSLTAWSPDIVLFTDGPAKLGRADRASLRRNRIEVVEDRIARLASVRGRLRAVVLRDGRSIPRKALYFDTPARGQSALTENLGCAFNRHGGVICGKYEATSVPGVYVAGNVVRNVQLSIVAAGEGASAAFGINRALTREDFERRATGARRVSH